MFIKIVGEKLGYDDSGARTTVTYQGIVNREAIAFIDIDSKSLSLINGEIIQIKSKESLNSIIEAASLQRI